MRLGFYGTFLRIILNSNLMAFIQTKSLKKGIPIMKLHTQALGFLFCTKSLLFFFNRVWFDVLQY